MSSTHKLVVPPYDPLPLPILQRIKENYKDVDVTCMPESYRRNTQEEEQVLEYVDNFRKQFAQLYPQRSDLFLNPRNECGIPV